MMKKEYIAPAIEVVEMEPVSMIADSQVQDDNPLGGNRDEEGEELSNRRRNFWEEMGSGW